MIFDLFKKTKNIFKIKEQKYLYNEWATTKSAEGFFSIVDRLPNPDIILRKAGKNIGVLRSLINHYQVGACIEQRKSGTKSCEWTLNENNCNKEHYKIYDYILKNIDIHTLISNILDTPLFGYVPIEIIWKKVGSYVLPVKCVAKPQEWFYFNSDGQFFFKDRTQSGKKEIDLENGYKFLLPRNNPDFLNPYGQAILSRCFWNVAFINGGMEFWVKFSEKYGMPYMFGKYDRSMTDNEKNDLLNALVNMVQDAIGVIPNDGAVEVINTGSSGNSEIYDRLVTKCEQNIAKSILGQTLTTDIGSSGSYAASQTHANVRADIVDSDKILVENTINQLIRYINAINFGDDIVPVFNFVGVEDLAFDKAERDNKVAALGVQFSADYIQRTYGYQEGDIEIVEKQNYSFSEKEEPQNFLNILDDVVNAEDLNIEPELKKIRDFLSQTRDAEETLEKLGDLYEDLDFDELEKKLTKVIFISELMGRLEASKGK